MRSCAYRFEYEIGLEYYYSNCAYYSADVFFFSSFLFDMKGKKKNIAKIGKAHGILSNAIDHNWNKAAQSQ